MKVTKIKLNESEKPESQILSPDISALYDTKNSVPDNMQLLRKAIAEETKSISDYESFLDSGIFTVSQQSKIREIVSDEKDHIVIWTNMLKEITDDNYKGYGNH